MIVLMDTDGVLADWIGSVIRVVNEAGVPLARSDVTEWHFLSKLKIDNFDVAAKIQADISKEGFCSSLEVLAGAKEGIEAVRATGAEVYFVTSPWESCKTWCYEREQWLTKNGFINNPKQVVYTSAKYMVKGDILVDDRPKNLEQWARANPTGAAFAWDAPYNKGYSGFRLRNWEDLVNYIEWRNRQ